MNNNLAVCPLCASSKIKCVENISVNELDRLYRRTAKYSITSLFGDLQSIDLCRCDQCDLIFFFPMISGSQVFYEVLQKIDWYYVDDKREFDIATQHIKNSDDVLEIGAGKGSFAKKIPSNLYTGLEFSEKAIMFAQANGVRLLAQSIQDYAKNNINKHDVVCNFQVLEHVSDVNAFLSSSVAALKPGGLMIISVPAADSFGQYTRNCWTDMPPHHLTRWTDLALTNLAKQYSLDLVTIHHEQLQEAHKIFYGTTIFSNAFANLLGKPYRTIDLSLSFRIIERLSTMLGKLFSKGLVAEELLPRGISLVAVYKKPN